MLRPRYLLIPEKKDAMFEQQRLDFPKERCIPGCVAQAHTGYLGTNAGSEPIHFHHD